MVYNMQALNASAVLCGVMGGGCTAEDGHGVAPVGYDFSLGCLAEVVALEMV